MRNRLKHTAVWVAALLLLTAVPALLLTAVPAASQNTAQPPQPNGKVADSRPSRALHK